MREGWQYVAGAYGASGLTLAVWFWMIGTKLRRLRRGSAQRTEAADA